jgi:hypothetical protein
MMLLLLLRQVVFMLQFGQRALKRTEKHNKRQMNIKD